MVGFSFVANKLKWENDFQTQKCKQQWMRNRTVLCVSNTPLAASSRNVGEASTTKLHMFLQMG